VGKHEPQIPPADDHEVDHETEADYGAEYEAATEAAPVLGPRQAAARSRSRRKRALVVASAAGLTLVVGGTAAAAVITAGSDPQGATNAAGIPQAQPQSLEVEEIEDAPGQAEGDDERSQAAAPQALTASGSDISEEPEEEQEESETEAPSTDSGGSNTSEGTGEGGTCEASFYGDGFHGATTASGETFDTNAMTAAHKTLPFDTMVKVTNPNNGSSVTVRINDRGPFISGRCLDLSTVAFDQVIGTGSGVGTVEWEVVG
jgi:rare lipoprotein A